MRVIQGGELFLLRDGKGSTDISLVCGVRFWPEVHDITSSIEGMKRLVSLFIGSPLFRAVGAGPLKCQVLCMSLTINNSLK
jgi:hypothetical protein